MDSVVIQFLYPFFILFLSSLSTYFLHLLHYFTRFTCNDGSSKGVLNDLNKIELIKSMEQKQDFIQEKTDFLRFSSEKNDEKEAPEVPFTFKFPTFEEFSKKHKEVILDDSEVETNSNNGVELDDYKVLDFQKGSVHMFDDAFQDQECVFELESLNGNKIGEVDDNEEIDTFREEKLHKVHDESADSNMDTVGSNEQKITQVDEFLNESVHISTDLNMDTIGSNNPNSPTNDLQPEHGFLSDTDFELELDEKGSTWTNSNFLSENNLVAKSRNISEPEETNENETGNEKNSSNDTTNKLECLWEHQELIEQLKMEIKKVKAIGLPTIFEESESPPKIMEELKPWKIEEVYQNGAGDGNMSEIHKFYKSYRERMRKFDIFNYQKMYAIGFLQLKDPFWSSSSSKSSVPEFKTLLNQSFTTNKGKKPEDDPTMKFIKELQSDLEVVYVGQMCMSWEILHWQYEKALDIWESDPRGVRRFNEIAGEFQQFQVLMQRFIEDEPFQGPRIQHYVKSRCVFRNLLQVPVIRGDDYIKNRKLRSEEVVYDITSDVLVEILEESIRIFWRFVRADKHKRQTPVELQKPEDLQLFTDLQKDLHKKEKKLKEQLRSGNCILRKLRRCREDDDEEFILDLLNANTYKKV